MLRFPSTNPSRKALCSIRLLTRVRERQNDALGFEGSFHRCGSAVDMALLARPAVALECAGPTGCRKGRNYLWILWRFDFELGAWIEIARAQAPDWTWAIALRPIALHALYGGSPPEPDIGLIADGVLRSLDEALEDIEPRFRPLLLSAIEPAVASRIAAYLE
jgi:hypothetical protein